MIFLMRVQSFNIVRSLVFHNLYIDEVYFPKLSCLIAADGGTLQRYHTTVAMHHIHDVTRPLVTLLLHCDVTWSAVA